MGITGKNKMNQKYVIGVVLSMMVIAVIAGCVGEPRKGERANMLDTQPTKTLKESNERKIFMGYLEQVNNPNNIQFIYLFDYQGHVIFRGAVMGKTISATKSSEPYERVIDEYNGGPESNEVHAAETFAGYIPGTSQLMNPSGMFGHDTPGVIWMDPQGNYHEWHNGPYLVTSYPVKIQEPILSFSNIDTEVQRKVDDMKGRLSTGQQLSNEDKQYLMGIK